MHKRAFGIVAASAIAITTLVAPVAAAPAQKVVWAPPAPLNTIIVATNTVGGWSVVPATGQLVVNDNNWTLVAMGQHSNALGEDVILDPVSSGWTGGCNPSMLGLAPTQDWQSVTMTNGKVKLVCHGEVS